MTYYAKGRFLGGWVCAENVCFVVEASCVMERSGYYAHVYYMLVYVL